MLIISKMPASGYLKYKPARVASIRITDQFYPVRIGSFLFPVLLHRSTDFLPLHGLRTEFWNLEFPVVQFIEIRFFHLMDHKPGVPESVQNKLSCLDNRIEIFLP